MRPPRWLLQASSLAGATLILVAFISATGAGLSILSPTYLLLNAVGSVLLGLSMIRPLNAGGLVLQAVWTGWSLWLLVRVLTS